MQKMKKRRGKNLGRKCSEKNCDEEYNGGGGGLEGLYLTLYRFYGILIMLSRHKMREVNA
jgi:hypothetical protein